MTDLELSIYEAERYGEIDEDTRDIMLEMVATEGANWDNMKKYTNIKNQVAKAIMQSKALLKKNDFSGAKAKMNEVKGYAQTIRQEIASSDSSVVSAVLSYFIPTIGEFAFNAAGMGVSIVGSSKMLKGLRDSGMTYDEIRKYLKSSPVEATEPIRKYTNTTSAMVKTGIAVTAMNTMKGAIAAIKEVKSSSSGEVNPSTLNRYKQVTVARMGDIIKGIDMYIKHIGNVEAEYNRVHKITSVGESVDDLKMEIYESERYGEISIEERDELLSYLD